MLQDTEIFYQKRDYSHISGWLCCPDYAAGVREFEAGLSKNEQDPWA